MNVIALRTLRQHWEKPGRADSEGPLKAWHRHVRQRQWRSWADIQADYGSADWVGGSRVVFNIAGNKYRLVAKVDFGVQRLYIRFIGTHREYDEIEEIKSV